MERTGFHLSAASARAFQFCAALGLVATVGCGSSSNGRDTGAKADGAVDRGASEASVSSEGGTAALEVLPREGSREVGPGQDGPSVAIDTAQDAEIPRDVPITTDESPDEVISPVLDGAGAAEGPEGTGGSGGSTAFMGTGGSAGIAGSGGDGGTSGTGGTAGGAPRIIGWPTTSAEAPYAFGPVTCNGAAQAAAAAYTFTLKNSGSATVTFVGASFSGAAGYSVNLTPGTSTLPPGETKAITITPPAIPFPLKLPASFAAVLTLTTDEPTDNVHFIHLTKVVHGARLAWGTGAVSSYLGGSAPGSTTPLSQDFTIVNSGDQSAVVDIVSTDPNFILSADPGSPLVPSATGVEIPTGEKGKDCTLSIIPPSVQGVYTTSIGLAPSAASNLCAPLPAPWTAYAMSIAGYPKFEPPGGTFPFSGPCGQQPEGQKIKITNVGTGTLKWLPVISTSGQAPCFVVTPTLDAGKDPEKSADWLSLDIGVTDSIMVTPTILAADTLDKCVGQQLVVQFCSEDAAGTCTYERNNLVYNNYYNLEVTPLGAKLAISPSALDFGSTNLLKSPPDSTVPKRTLTLQNLGWVDPLGSPTSAIVTLSLTNSAYAFDTGSTQTAVTLQASTSTQPGAPQTVTIEYRRPLTGPYQREPDDGAVTWVLDEQNHSCMYPQGASGTPITRGSIPLTGRVIQGAVSFNTTTEDFGMVFCGAKATPKDLVLTNTGDGPLAIESASLGSEAYFSFSTSHPLDAPVQAGGSVTFHIVPKTIRGADIAGPSDLASSKFSTTLTITTDARNPADQYSQSVFQVDLKMWAQGVIIESGAPPTWSYPPVVLPHDRSSTYWTWVTNRGNAKGEARLAVQSEMFHMDPIPIPAKTTHVSLWSTFGTFTSCDTEPTTYNAFNQLSIVADLSTAQDQDLQSTAGVCQDVQGAWGQDLALTGNVSISTTTTMCPEGQRCDTTTTHSCVCDAQSCAAGCCSPADGTCVSYGKQGALQCGKDGDQCKVCSGPKNYCYAGDCSCPVGTTPCSGSCCTSTQYCASDGSCRTVSGT